MGLLPFVCAVLLLYPAFPERWEDGKLYREDELSDPAPVVVPAEKDLALQKAALAGNNEPVLRMRIAADLSAGASKRAFAVLEEAFAREKDAALKTCYLRNLLALDRCLGAGKTPLKYPDSVTAALSSPSGSDRAAAAALLFVRGRTDEVFSLLERETEAYVLRSVFAYFNPEKLLFTSRMETLARGNGAAKKFALGYLAASRHNDVGGRTEEDVLDRAVKSAPAEDLIYAAAGLAGNFERKDCLSVLLQRRDLPPALRASALALPLPDAAGQEELLLTLAADADPGVRAGACASLAGVKTPRAKAALLKAFTDDSLTVRTQAAQALAGWKMKTLPPEISAAEKINPEGLALLMGCSGNKAYLPHLLELMPDRGRTALTAACIRALGELGAESECARLAKYVEKQQPEIADALVSAMIRFRKNETALKTLERLLCSIQPGVGVRAARALGESGAPEFQQPLAAVIASPGRCSAEARLECIRSLAAGKKLETKTVRALGQVLQANIRDIPGGRAPDLVPLRAGAYYALKLHEHEPEAGAVLKAFARVRNGAQPLPALLTEYLNQIDRVCAGKAANPSVLPVVRGDPVLKGL